MIERLRVIERREGVSLVGEEMRCTNFNYGSEFLDVSSLVMNGSGFVGGFYNCCTFDSNFTDDNGFGKVLLMMLMMMVLGAGILDFFT